VNFYPNQAVYPGQPGSSGRITVRDAGQCYQAVNYTLPNPANPQPAGQLIDYFTYDTGNARSQVEVYGLYDYPYTIQAWSRSNTPLPGNLTPEQRGHPEGYELHPRCGGAQGTTLIQAFTTMSPPYARLQVTEDSPVCGYNPPPPPDGEFRFDYVLGTNETTRGGDGVIQAAVLGNDGPVLFSLDNYKTPGQVSGTFQGLRAGTYRVYARETKAGGRTIWRDITLSEPPMGARYEIPFTTTGGLPALARLDLRGYFGPVETLRGAKGALQLDWAGGNASAHFFEQLLSASAATLTVEALTGNDLADLDLSDERQMRLLVLVDDNVAWVGWVLPDLYEVPLLARPYPVSIRATDGLGALKDVPLTDGLGNPLTGEYTHWQLLRYFVGRLALPLPWSVLHTLYPADTTPDLRTEALQLMSTDAAGFAESDGKPWTCEKVLLELLTYHRMRMQQREGQWFFERLPELSTERSTAYRYYDETGGYLPGPGVSLLHAVELPPRQNGTPARYWQNKQQLLSRHPAVAGVLVSAEPGEPRNYFPRPDFPASDFDALRGNSLTWTGPADSARVPDPADLKKPVSLQLKSAAPGLNAYLDAPPVLLPVAGRPLTDALGGPAGYFPFQVTLSFTVKLTAGSFQPDPSTGRAALYIQLGVRDPDGNLTEPTWLFRGDLKPDDPAPSKIPVYELTGTSAAKVSIPFRANLFTPRTEVTVRVYAPTFATDSALLFSEPKLTIGTATNGSFVNTSEGETKAGPRLTKRDNSLTLQLADTLNPDERVFSVLARSVLLAATGGPVGLYREGLDPLAPAYYGIDLAVRDRLTWQQKPCWVLRGLLRGSYSPGALLVDPAFDETLAFVTTAASWNVSADTWNITAVQGLGYVVALPEVEYCLLAEDGSPLLKEDGAYLLAPEDAY
jgi:hypothetical protein